MAKDWTKIQKKYKGLWVALKSDEETVVASALTAKEALAKARNSGYEEPILTRMPEKVVPYVGTL